MLQEGHLSALLVGREFLSRHLEAGLPADSHPVCSFTAGNRECLGKGCRFHPGT